MISRFPLAEQPSKSILLSNISCKLFVCRLSLRNNQVSNCLLCYWIVPCDRMGIVQSLLCVESVLKDNSFTFFFCFHFISGAVSARKRSSAFILVCSPLNISIHVHKLNLIIEESSWHRLWPEGQNGRPIAVNPSRSEIKHCPLACPISVFIFPWQAGKLSPLHSWVGGPLNCVHVWE